MGEALLLSLPLQAPGVPRGVKAYPQGVAGVVVLRLGKEEKVADGSPRGLVEEAGVGEGHLPLGEEGVLGVEQVRLEPAGAGVEEGAVVP